MSSQDKLQEYGATIMAHLEDANIAAMEIQGQGKTLKDITYELKIICMEVQSINDILSTADNLIISLKPQ